MMAQVCNLGVGDFIHTIGDAHLYINHLEQANLQVARKPLPLPALHLNQSIMHINDFTYEDIEVRDYEHHPHIAAPISV
jgi:thymidylate synthase